jgi:hypothetical protein
MQEYTGERKCVAFFILKREIAGRIIPELQGFESFQKPAHLIINKLRSFFGNPFSVE